MSDFNLAAHNLGKVYGLAENALPKIFGGAQKKDAAVSAPFSSLPEIMRLLIANNALNDSLDNKIGKLLNDVSEDFPAHATNDMQSCWWLGYFSVRSPGAHGIAAQRKKAGLTQSQLADAIGTDQRAISRWEQGSVVPSANWIKKIADALNCSANDLI